MAHSLNLNRQALEACRLGKGWSKREMARNLGVHASTYIRVANGKYEPNDLMIRELARTLGVALGVITKPHHTCPACGRELAEAS